MGRPRLDADRGPSLPRGAIRNRRDDAGRFLGRHRSLLRVVATACLWRYLVLGAYGSYEIAAFVGDNQRIKGGFTIAYYFNPVLSLYGRYEHTAFISTDAARDFDEDEVRMGLKLRR
jgi:hypothetical protein